jgi:RNA polymerase sigma-70 factor (ECF subfamily)
MKLSRAELDQLYRYSLALTGRREEAEDLLQACLAECLERRRESPAAPLAYLRQMLRSRYYDGLRRARGLRFEPIEEAALPSDPQQALEQMVVDALTLARIWRELDAGEREVLYLWAVDGLSASEIALQLGQPRGSVLSRMHRARQKMQKRFPGLVGGGQHE